jgi:hypothetical protein
VLLADASKTPHTIKTIPFEKSACTLHWVCQYWGRTLLSSSLAKWQQLFGLDEQSQAFFLIFNYQQSRAAVPGGRFSNPPTSASPIVVRHAA